MIPTLEWLPTGVNFLDQTKLPLEETYVLATDYKQVATVIRDMIVRGAPAIGVSAAMGVAIGIDRSTATTLPALTAEVDVICADPRRNPAHRRQPLLGHRPRSAIFTTRSPQRTRPFPRSKPPSSPKPAACTTKTSPPASHGRTRRSAPAAEGTVLTHCNAGALATCGYGSALGVIRAAVERGHKIDVFADETRPFLQGARLTAWELMKDNIPTTVLCDNMAAHLMRQGPHPGRHRRRRPHRRQRRHRQQDRHLRRRHPRQRARHPLLRRRPLVHHRPRHRDTAMHPHRAARPPAKSPTPTASR